jgi:TPP-dependent pyruvate/acetoin dehydrogenase alpha subunit
MSARSQRRNDVPPGAEPVEFLKLMWRTRLFEEFSMRLKKEGAVLGNTYPCLGQEALGIAAMALAPGDAVFPSYRSRAIVFGKGATVQQHFREMICAPEAEQGGREVFHHAAFPAIGVMPSSSMIGGWAPTAAGYALTQQMEKSGNVTVCVIGDGSYGAGDVHEALNIVGTWKLPFVLMVENNGYQVSAAWNQVRAQKALAPYVAPYGFVTRPVDGNNPFDVFHSMAWARAEALAGRPAMLDCETYRMGGYSSHFGEPRSGIDAELAAWRARDPIAFMEDWLERHGGMARREIAAIRATEADAISAAWKKAKAGGGRGKA